MPIAELRKRVAQSAESPSYHLEKTILELTERLWELMDDRGMSRSDLAERLGRSRAWVSKLLRGDHNMTLKTLSSVLWELGYVPRIECEHIGESDAHAARSASSRKPKSAAGVRKPMHSRRAGRVRAAQ